MMLICVWFGDLCGAGVDFFQAVVKGRVQTGNCLVGRFRFIFYCYSWSRFWWLRFRRSFEFYLSSLPVDLCVGSPKPGEP